MAIEFTDRQRKTIASGMTLLSLAVVVVFVSVVVWGLLRMLSFASAAIVPVVLGFFLSLFFKPYYRWWLGLLRNPTLALVVMLLSVFVPMGVLLWCAGSIIVDEIMNLVEQGPQLADQVLKWFHSTFPGLQSLLTQMGVRTDDLSGLYTRYGNAAMKAGSGALKCMSGILTALVTLIFFVFFLMTRERRGGEVVAEMPFLKPETKAFVAEQIDAFFDILVSFFQRQTVICLIEGCYYGLGFWLVGLPYGFLIGFALGVINLIPLCGSVICLPIALPLAYFFGGSGLRLTLVLTVWALGQLLDGYLITPKIQGNRTGLGYAGVIFSFFFWSTLLGPVLGMLLAIPLSAFCVVLWRSLKSKYLRPVV